MEANYVHKDSTTLIQDKLVKNELNQIELQYNALKQQKFNELLKENKKLKEKVKKLSQWDINKDTRNSRQRVANAKLLKENQELKEKLDKYENPEDMTLMMMWCTEQVKDENKKLKEKYLNAVADYETTMFEKEQLNSLVNSCQEEIRQLKKQLEDYKKLGFKHLQDKNNNLETQQKEFISYLEDKIYSIEPKGTGINYNCEYDSEEDYVNAMKEQSKLNTLKEILQKYKEIMGDINDKK